MADARLPPARDPLQEPAWVRWTLIGLATAIMLLIVVMPLLMLLGAALGSGLKVWFAAVVEPHTIHALKLTLLTAAIVVPVNAICGVFTAWAVTRFEFRGKRTLMALIDLPFAVSPVVAGLCLVLLFSPTHGYFADLLNHYDIKILFATPGIVLATMFVTFPFVVRELIPLMEQQGSDEELAARSLGANAWTMFFRVTLPNIKWGLLYGVLLCSARAMGEFGAVTVVSGNVMGQTNTLSLHVEVLYKQMGGEAAAAFAVASLLAGLALVTLVVKIWLEARHGDALARSHRRH
ncbi:sulfate ABC transporter permease subunit CysW [Lysobacter capsici]|uniref:sulfate ABC transporter permease subunit CysW n=1 Tax=Lysobacter capsici TaxID=435897 RepID=UPI00287B8884|nr:sulfate ABC transporter permease subunit CysW [Lysobacter capsici]WND80236.1 sulfate ABC transporter permease subunit CysW [Lysobacter capsici]WND85432.1 sulfate ABC transporter permease subunit CysW [Lysobacter capsici]